MTVLSRLGALVVAIALVLGAFALRDGRQDPAWPVPGGEEGPTDVALCPDGLGAVCDAFPPDRVRAGGSAAEVADALVTEEGTALLPAAWADVVDDRRSRGGLVPLARSEVLASSPLVLVSFADRAQVLAEACGIEVEALGWPCLGEHAGRAWTTLDGQAAWGEVRLGHLPPDTASGLQATAQVVAAKTGLPFALADLQDVQFTTWFREVERAVQPLPTGRTSHLTAMRVSGPSAANAATVLEAELVGVDLRSASSFGPLVASAPTPLLVVELVVVGTDGDTVAALAGDVDAGVLAEAGWRTGDGPPAGAPVLDLPPPAETPGGGVLTALRTTWEQVAG